MNAEKSYQLGQEIVLCQQAFSLVGVKWLEIFLRDVYLSLALLNVILFKHCVLNQVGVSDVIEDCIAEDFHFLIACVQRVRFLEATMRQGFQEQIFVLKLKVKYFLNRSAN